MSQENVGQESEVKVPQLASFFIETGRITRSYGMHFAISYTYYCDNISFLILPHNRKWQAFYLPFQRRVYVDYFNKNGKEVSHFVFSYDDQTLYDSGSGIATGKEIVEMTKQAVIDGLVELNRSAQDNQIFLT
jgi:hypothetical protein